MPRYDLEISIWKKTHPTAYARYSESIRKIKLIILDDFYRISFDSNYLYIPLWHKFAFPNHIHNLHSNHHYHNFQLHMLDRILQYVHHIELSLESMFWILWNHIKKLILDFIIRLKLFHLYLVDLSISYKFLKHQEKSSSWLTTLNLYQELSDQNLRWLFL